jgi:hypothetical protein
MKSRSRRMRSPTSAIQVKEVSRSAIDREAGLELGGHGAHLLLGGLRLEQLGEIVPDSSKVIVAAPARCGPAHLGGS